MKIIGIYKITNLVNGSVYIGQSRDCVSRENNYKNLNCESQIKIYRSIKKHRWENFSFEVILNCEIEELNKYEYELHQTYLLELGKDKMLNCSAGGGQTIWVSEETRKKMSESKKNMSDETRKKIGESSKGRTHSEEAKKKISDAEKGENNHNFGKTRQEETRKKISETSKGKTLSEETKKKIGESGKGKTRSEETKKRMSDASKGKPKSDEHRKKMSESQYIKINQYGIDGTFVKTWDSRKDIKEFYNIDKITSCYKGRTESAYNFIWKYFKDYPDCSNLSNITT